MTRYQMVECKEQSYLYNERSCSMDPADISKNMGVAFQAVGDLIASKGITSATKPLSVYYGYDPQIMTFRAGFLVSAAETAKAEGDVKADVLPAGQMLNYIHKGPYAMLRVSYDAAMKYISENGMTVGAPTWEIYLNEPDDVKSEDALRTDIYITVNQA
ncbi:effector-binding domain-containing protein [Cognatiyoonia koreensis]|uniref:Effector-binding domain-containing protein n=1 Tax=Cognatiyoonia koreensis TaxID=364200 RepID=A0A1I0NVW9_9RHOB|nr:GyrI-like domain-containing protein [Cognatiyoonia koreensis]SEW05906.1 effector-binding domain-containing protein [Cognatiyoonia koreensis]